MRPGRRVFYKQRPRGQGAQTLTIRRSMTHLHQVSPTLWLQRIQLLVNVSAKHLLISPDLHDDPPIIVDGQWMLGETHKFGRILFYSLNFLLVVTFHRGTDDSLQALLTSEL